jgi:hypothetical protein
MVTTRTTRILAFVGMFAVSACRDKPTCLDCDDAGEAKNDEADDNGAPAPDLSCGGADLMTDNLNCGTCGNECVLYYAETEYEAGTCNEGVCGPGWTDCLPEIHENCEDLCVGYGATCVPNGCAGLTGLVFTVNIDGIGCGGFWHTLVAEMSGGCDEPIPWMPIGQDPRHVECCCDFQ